MCGQLNRRLASQSPLGDLRLTATFSVNLEAAHGCSLERWVLTRVPQWVERSRFLNQLKCLPSEIPLQTQAIDLVRPVEKHASHIA